MGQTMMCLFCCLTGGGVGQVLAYQLNSAAGGGGPDRGDGLGMGTVHVVDSLVTVHLLEKG
jgi:hypothetical protein